MPATDSTCSIDGCARPVRTAGWCSMHYQRVCKHGDPHRHSQRDPLEVRLWRNVNKTDGCWEWTGRTLGGYGRIKGGASTLVHRVSYELLVGAIPDGLTLDHLCRNRSCVNPDHLEPVTNRENGRRGESPPARNARKTHCIHGHEFSVENTRIRPSGHRGCIACSRISNRAYKARKRVAGRVVGVLLTVEGTDPVPTNDTTAAGAAEGEGDE